MRSLRIALLGVCVFQASCAPALMQGEAREANTRVPDAYTATRDTQTSARVDWNDFFSDAALVTLIDGALQNNQELNIAVQEILVANADVLARRGEYLPRLGFQAGAGIDKVGGTTSQGVSDEAHGLPATLQNYGLGFYASWEIDVWRKLRNAADAAVLRYLASVEGRNFMVTRLVAEIADLYYELMALDRALTVVRGNIELLENGLVVVRLQKEAARVTELAVTRFESEVLKNKSRQYEIQQQIVEAENRLNFLVGRFPQPVARDAATFLDLSPAVVHAGVPTQLLENRPDIRQAELELRAAKLDVDVARASFYPSLSIEAGVGYGATRATRLLNTPESLLYNLLGNLTAPLLNRNALTADYNAANARQMQAVLGYEKSILGAYTEVANQLAMIENIGSSYDLKAQQVERLTAAIDISNQLFASARADYLEVLTTRRDALEAQMELIETKQRQMTATVNLYQALGGGWRAPDPAPRTTSTGSTQSGAQQ